jgi:hypothetical protein
MRPEKLRELPIIKTMFWGRGLFISQKWLKNFINQKELAELVAIRILGNAK